MLGPNFHVPVGHFSLSPRGTSDDVFVDLGGYNLRLDRTTVLAILQELGVSVAKHARASWEHRDWELVNDEIRFHVVVGSATPEPESHERKIEKNVVKDTLLLLKCPHLTEGEDEGEEKIVLKDCRNCTFAKRWDGYECLHEYTHVKPVREMDASGLEKYISKRAYNGWDWGEIAASLSFQVIDPERWLPTRWKRLVAGLRSTHQHDAEKHAFIRPYPHFTTAVQSTITLDPKAGTGRIESTEISDLSSAEDWLNLKFYLPTKVNHVLREFVEVCWWTNGNVRPLPLEEKEDWGQR